MGKITFITGPVRSGKSSWAVAQAMQWGERVVFVATYRPDPLDQEMAERLRRHRAERPAGWRTLEAPADPAAALNALVPPPSGVLLDCLTLWLGDRMEASDEAILAAWDRQLRLFAEAPWPVLLVSNEVGWSPVPEQPMVRRFRDLAGWLNQRTASAAGEAWLSVAGCRVRLK
ncbi:MAG: bifunctional adenosylcobinamide kinase/adenosylcobinamide-phosphate guanylyltransferase [Holophaga sp.]|nr:bifunctional adenosylcobinamide kinase/adenosylcobinamide-phosphate guanylyltransferase [Holophaga sp.]